MNVLFFPYWPANPYQPNLASALEDNGVLVKGVEDTTFQTLKDSVNDQEILHLHWANPYLLAQKLSTSIRMSFLFFRFLRKQMRIGRKLVWTIHNLGEHEPRHPKFELYCHRKLFEISDGIIVHSRYARDKVIKVFKMESLASKIKIIPHGNYIKNYPNDISRESARERLGIDLGKKVFLFLGSVRQYKGLPELIASFSRIATGNELLMLVGNPLNEKIKTEISRLAEKKKDVIFSPGFVPEEEIQVYMNAADAVVFPFRDIFTSGSVLLAMSFAKALMIPDIESLEEIAKCDGVIAYDPQREDGLEKALAASLSMDLQKLGRANLKEAQKYSWDLIAEETVKLYRQILVH